MRDMSPISVAESICLVLTGLWAMWPAMATPLARMFPRVFAALMGALGLWTGGVLLLAVHLPAALHPLAALSLAATAGFAYRNRSGYGRTRHLPPGSLSLATSFEALLDREFYRRTAARLGPVFKMAQFHQPVICIVGLARVQTLLHQHEQALAPSVQPFNSAVQGGFLRYMSVETHGIYGPLFRQALSSRVVTHSAPAIAEATRLALSDASGQAGVATPRSVAPDVYLERIVDHAFLRAIFGVVPGTPDGESLKQAYAPLATLGLSDKPTPRALAALAELRRLLTARVQQWRTLQAVGIPVCALSELVRLDARMPDTTCLDNLVFVYKVSASNVVGLLRWLLVMLGRHPEWIASLRSQLQAPAAETSPALVDRIVMETLRLSQSEYLYRRLREDLRFEGFVLPKGWLVRLCIWESHREAGSFDDPERFDPDRFLAHDYPRSAYMPFGGDRHACNGVALTNVICRAFLEELTRGYDWGIEGAADLQRDFRHWSHWRPAASLRLRLTPVSR